MLLGGSFNTENCISNFVCIQFCGTKQSLRRIVDFFFREVTARQC